MNLNENAYKLLRGRTDVDRSPLTLEKLRAHANDAYLKQFARIFVEWHARVEKHKPDCEYLVHLENANAHVMMLEAIGVVTPAFATRFAHAVDVNVEVAMNYMTPEAREAKLRPGARQYVYEIHADDMSMEGAMASPGRHFVSATPKKKGSKLNMDVDPMKLSAPADPDEARVPAYDRGDGLYAGLTELGRWVVVNDDDNALLDKDRWKSFTRFVTGTHTNMALLGAGSIIVVAAADFIPTPLRLAMLGAGGFFLKRSARRALNGRWRQQAEEGVGLAIAAGAIEGARYGIQEIIVALQVALQEPQPVPRGMIDRAMEYFFTNFTREWYGDWYFGGGEDTAWNLRLATASERVREVNRVLQSSAVTRFLVGALANRHVLGVGVVGTTLLYYAGYHHSGRYIPNRQRYYLGINSAKRLKAQTKALRDRLDQTKDQIAVLNGRLPNVEEATEALRRAKRANLRVVAAQTTLDNTKDDKVAGKRVIKEFNEEKVDIKDRLDAIDRDRAAVAPDDDDLQLACAAVDALVVRILDEKDNQIPNYKRRLDAAVALARQDLPFWPPGAGAAHVAPPVGPLAPLAPVAPVAPGEALAALNAVGGNGQGASAVDEVFAQLRL